MYAKFVQPSPRLRTSEGREGILRSLVRSKIVRALMGVGVAGALLFTGSAAQSALTGSSGSYIERQSQVTENLTYTNSSAASTWQNVPGMSRSFTIASGTRREFVARYTAESWCTGTSGYCSVRVLLTRPGGAVTELNPVAGVNFAFDSASTDRWESNAIDRSTGSLPAGTYTLRVQATKVGAGVSSLQLDEQHFTVGVLRP
jgi:hypothetical protein